MSEKQEPGLGAVSVPLAILVTVGGTQYEFRSDAVSFTPQGSETQRGISGTGTFLPVGTPTPTPTPTPAPPIVTKVTLAQAGDGTVIRGEVTLDQRGVMVAGTVFLKGDLAGLSLPATLTVNPGATLIPFTAAVPPVEAPTVLRVTATLGNSQVTGSVTLQPRPHPVPTPTPTPAPGPLKNVRDYGATGNGSTDDRAAIQRAIDGAYPGQTVFFPKGQYLIRDTVKLYNKSGIGFLGEGMTSLLLHPQGNGLTLSNGNPLTGITVKDLAFQGSGDGVFLFGTQGAVISGCHFTDCGHAVFCAGNGTGHGATKGTQILNCTVTDWATVALFLNGDDLVQGCQLVQTKPRGTGSHGIYIHSGASGCTVEDTLIRNSHKYAAQIYGEQMGTVTRNTTLRRLTIEGGQGGIILAHSQMGAADIESCLIEDCTISEVWGGAGLHYKNGKGVVIRGNKISGVQGPGMTIGYLAPYEQNFSLGPALIENNRVSGCTQGFWAMQSHGATFNEIHVLNNDFSGNLAHDIHLEEWEGVKPHLTLTGNLGRVAGMTG